VIRIDPLVLRRMRPHDIDPVVVIDEAVYSRPWSAQTWRRELADAQRHHLVATRGADVVGHAGMLLVVDQVHLTTVAVAPASQGAGVATALVLELLDEALARGVDEATLEVRASDRRAQRMYSRLGFAPAGIRRRYYTDPVDDAIVMWLSELGDARTAERHEPIRSALLERSTRDA
jgi:ribosomal-protein-alanine N-acetyltransferase